MVIYIDIGHEIYICIFGKPAEDFHGRARRIQMMLHDDEKD